jgi:hypothetical protein
MQVKAGGFAMIYKIDKQIFYTSITRAHLRFTKQPKFNIKLPI